MLRNKTSIFTMRHRRGRASIGDLFFSGCPAKIIGCVWAVIVSAIQRQSWWRITDVCIKGFKVHPSLANLNSSSAVVNVGGIVGVGTTRFHCAPDAVDGGSPFTVSKSGFGFMPETTARLRISSSQIGGRDSGCLAALTEASPAYWLFAFKVHDSKFAKNEPCEVAPWWSVANFCHAADLTQGKAHVNGL